MEYSRENLPKSKIKFTITISKEEFKKYYEAAFQKLASDVEIRGFRKGKAPRYLAEAEIGPDKIFSEALDTIVPEVYKEVVVSEKVVPVSQPKVQIKEFDPQKPLKFSAEVDILPEVKLPDYQKVKVKKPKISVSEKEFDNAIENIKKSYAEFKQRKGGAKKGDKIEIDFEGSLGGVKIESLISKNHPVILGETKLIPGFTEKLTGVKKGEERKFKLKIPKNAPDKTVAGKEVGFRVKVKKVDEIIYPAIDEKFVKKISKFKNIKEFKDHLKKTLLSQKEIEEEKRLQNEVVKKISDKVKIEIPENLVNVELARMIEDLSARIQMQGGTLDNWLSSINKTREDFQKELRGQAEESVKINLIVSRIREEEKIKAKDTEIDQELEMLKAQGQQVPNDESTRRYIGNILGNRKVIKKLVENATK